MIDLIKSGLIKPGIAFAFLKSEIARSVGYKPEAFEISCIVEQQKLVIDCKPPNETEIRRYNFNEDHDKLVKGVKAVVNGEIKNGSLDAFQIHFEKNNSYIQVYFTDAEKQHIKRIPL